MRLIDADELLKNLEDLCKDCDNNDGILCEDCDLAEAISYVKEAPTIDAQPVKRGKWIEVRKHRDADGCIVTDYKCSECGIMLRDTNPDDRDSEFYCYHCGAYMRGDEDERVD